MNQLYDSDDLHDYKYGKIYPETAELSAQDKERLELILEIIRMNENHGEKENVFQQYHRNRLPDWKSITKEDLAPLLSLDLGMTLYPFAPE